MAKKQVWYFLPQDVSPDTQAVNDSPAYVWREFGSFQESSGTSSDLSQYTLTSPQDPSLSQHTLGSSQEHSLSQYSLTSPPTESESHRFRSPPRSSVSLHKAFRDHVRNKMDTNTTGETFSTNDSQDMSSSQQASTASEGQYGFDDGNSTSSLHESPHDEVVNSAIMEVSGELMLGRFKPHKQPSGGSESSDISDDDGRRGPPGGSIAKYPESSTGLSDNDWNPYATESDTNQTPRSPRSNASDDQSRPGFVSKATFNFTGPQTKSDESTATVSMTTGEVTVDKNTHAGIERNENLGILRYLIDSSGQKERDIGHLDDRESDRDMITDSARAGGRNGEREDEDARTETPDTVRSLHTDGSKSSRQSVESERSDDFRRESAESGKSFHTETSGRSSGRLSTESGRSDRSDSYRSGRQSTDSGRSVQSVRYDMDKSGENGASGRQSTESYHSLKSDHSRHSDQSEQSQKSTGRSNGSDRSDRLDRLGDVGENIKELIEFESAQRAVPQTGEKDDNKTANNFTGAEQDKAKRDGSSDSVTRTRLTARLEPYINPVRSAESPELSSNKFSSNSYVSVAERQRLLSESPELVAGAATGLTAGPESTKQNTEHQTDYLSQMDRRKPAPSSMNLPSMADRSPSDVSLKRVSDLFEETKRQARAAVSIPRPDPSGSEERFPLKERLDWSHHEDSFLSQNRGLSDRNEGKLEKSRDSETARSINSEEVARVLGKYADEDETAGSTAPVSDSQVKVSAFDRLDPADSGPRSYQSKSRGSSELADSMKTGEMSDDEIARRVKAILSDSNQYGVVGGNGTSIHRDNIPSSKTEYVPRTIDYSRLQRDLQDIQNNLHDVPESKANDSLYVQKRNVRERSDEASPADEQEQCKSLETTGSGSVGRESGASEYGRKLVWDHGADLNYDTGYRGEFMGTDTNSGTLSSRRFGTRDSDDTLRFRPDSAATDASLGELDADTLRTSTDITRAEKIVKQVMDRRAEGDLKENVEDIIAKYRNERRDLFDKQRNPPPPSESGDNISTVKYRVQVDQMKHGKESGAVPRASDLPSSNYEQVTRELSERLMAGQHTLLQPENKVSGPSLEKPTSPLRKPVSSPLKNGRKEPGLAERVFKILTTDQAEESDTDEKGMAKEVYKILAQDRPQEQVNGILSTAMEEENEMLKKLTSQATNEDTSLDDSGLNESVDSTFLEGRDIRKQLEWSLMSSPDKGDKTGVSDYTAIRKVTSAPYSSVSNAKTLLSSQLKKMTERNFDKSVELRTPYRQAIACYPVYDMEKDEAGKRDQDRKPDVDRQGDVREAWMPGDRAAEGTARRDGLASDRFYLTDKDRNMRRDAADSVQHAQRRLSDPFDVTPSYGDLPAEREHHMRSRSEEAANVSEFSDYSFHEPRASPSVTDRRAASSPKRSGTDHDAGTLMTPDQHRPQDSRGGGSPSPTESDTSSSRRGARLRPYRPAGSRDVYYTESGDDTNESGTTVESTHPGSDDAVPPYIPKQFLGSRQDEPSKHATGIYGVPVSQDVLSTIDEQSAKDEKEKALSVSTGSGKEEAGRPDDLRSGRKSPYDRTDATRAGALASRGQDNEVRLASREPIRDPISSREPVPSHTQDTGYQSRASGYRTSAARSVSPYNARPDLRSRSPHCDTNDDKPMLLSDQHRFKTREEFKAEFERQEQELKDVLAGRGPRGASGSEMRDQRSAGNGSAGVESLEHLGSSIRSDPGEMLDAAGARWEYRESDINEFRRLEPEPVYPQDRLRNSRSRSDTDLANLSPTESQRYSSPMQPGTRFLELSNQPSPISHHNSITYQPGPTAGASRERTARGEQPAELPRIPPEREQNRYVPSRTDIRRSPAPLDLPDSGERPVRPLEPGSVPMRQPESGRSLGQPRSGDILEQVELGADPRRMGGIRPRDRSRSPPLQVRQKKMEEELTKINRELSDQVNAMQGPEKVEQQEGEEFEDNFPPSKKAQVLREVLEQEYMDTVPPNINDMWTRFKEKQEQSHSESSMNSTRLDALSGLLNNPTKHKVTSCGKSDRKRENRRNGDKENNDRLKEEGQLRAGDDKKVEDRGVEKRSKRRHEVRQKHGLSEEESNGSYTEILMENERRKEREKRNARKEARAEKKGKSPKKSRSDDKKDDKGTITEISSKARVGRAQLSDTVDTLFSIPEDASVENSPCKAESEMRLRQRRHRHVIDPLMSKLRDKIKLQRVKIDKERRKELQRVEKLKKLEMLLKAKRKGKLSDKAIDVELNDVSTTTSVSQGSDSSHMFSDTTLASAGSESDGSSTLIDSTADSIKLQVKRYPEEAFMSPKKGYVESDSTESSDFSNIIVERLKQGKSDRKSPVERGRKSGSKSKKVRVDEFGNKVHKGKKDKKRQEFYGVEMDEDILAKQLRNYSRYISPERRGKHTHDVSTMYPSPITVSPPTRRRLRDVTMKSAAIQTSPSVRSSSPSHAYEEVPVAPVPLMSNKYSKSSRRRPSPSPTRSTHSSPPRRSSRSPTGQRSSKSPSTARKSSKSPARSAPPIPRKLVESPMWKPERETPPHNRMFTPEDSDENTLPTANKGPAQTWFIPMKPSKPWRQPFKERQAFAVGQETWEPESVSQVRWKNIVHGDVLKDKADPNDVSRDTKFDLDPEGRPVGDENTLDDSDDSDLDVSRSKPLSKMSLQEAFQQQKIETISRLRERQKRLNLAAEERKMQAFLKMERDRLFNEERRKEANPEAHPYSDNLFKPARRVISKEEMKEMTQKRYKKLPEVLEQEKMKKRQEDYSLNRLKARLFNRKMQKKVLVKAEKWGR